MPLVLTGLLVAAILTERWLIPQTLLYTLPSGGAFLPPLLAAACATWVAARALRRQLRPFDVAWCTAFIIVSLNLGVHFLTAATWCGYGPWIVATGLLMALRPPSDAAFRRGSSGLPIIIIVPAGLLACSVILDAENLWHLDKAWRPAGLLLNKNFAGEYLALALPWLFVTACASHATSRRWRAAAQVVLFAAVAALVATRCRTAWLAALASVATMAWLRRASLTTTLRAAMTVRRRRLTIAAAALALVTALALPTRVQWTFADKRNSVTTLQHLVDLKSSNARTRIDEYAVTARVLAERHRLWSGFGAGQWSRHTLFGTFVPHVDYVRVLSDGGAAALLAFAIALGLAAAAAWRRRTTHPEQLAFIVALVVDSLAEAPLFRPESIPLVIAALTLTTAPQSDARNVLGVHTRDALCAPAVELSAGNDLAPAAAVTRTTSSLTKTTDEHGG